MKKKKNQIQFWDFMSLNFHALKTIQIYFFFFKIDLSLAIDHVCYKLLYGFPSLGCKDVTLNMFAIIYTYIYIFGETNTHTREREMSSNTKAPHNSTQKL